MAHLKFPNMGWGLVLVLSELLFVPPSCGLFFHMRYNERKCFIEEIPDDTTVIWTYKLETWDSSLGNFSNKTVGQGLHVEIKDPLASIVLSKVYNAAGRFTFTSHMHGEHSLCLQSNTSSEHMWGMGGGGGPAYKSPSGDLRVHLDSHLGGQAVDYNLVQKKEKLTEIQLQLRKLMDLADQIRKYQDYQRNRENRFRQTSDSTNSRVFWFAIIQTLILLATGYWQISNLRTFFIQKKLV